MAACTCEVDIKASLYKLYSLSSLAYLYFPHSFSYGWHFTCLFLSVGFISISQTDQVTVSSGIKPKNLQHPMAGPGMNVSHLHPSIFLFTEQAKEMKLSTDAK